MTLREGALASWVGDDPDLSIGERCRVIKLERGHCHVKWTTGARLGAFELVANDDLVADLTPARDLDAFTFDARPNRMVTIASRDVYDRKGGPGLWQALRSAGHLEPIVEDATAKVASLVAQLRSDPAWAEVRADLGDASEFERYVIRQALLAALGTVDGYEAAQAPGA